VLGERSEQIGEIIKVINDIANQTQPACPERSYRGCEAGEQGRGFAVVADEVRKLAERTTSATNEIGDMIKSIQERDEACGRCMQSATKEVEEGVALANQADGSLKQIMGSVQNVMDMVQQIAESARQCRVPLVKTFLTTCRKYRTRTKGPQVLPGIPRNNERIESSFRRGLSL